ncbi:MAG: CPBP family intramembrane metalloprotease [Anaerolineales bacterium]
MNIFLNIFYNRSESRLRALWRLLIVVFLALSVLGVLSQVAVFIIAFLFMLAAQIPFSALGNGQVLAQDINTVFHQLPMLIGIRSLIILLLIGLVFTILARWIDHRPWRDYGFHFNTAWWRDLGFGLILGMILMGAIFGVEYLLGWVSVSKFFENGQPQLSFWQLLVSGFFYYILVGVEEELFTRGYLIQNLAEGLHLPQINSKVAVLIAYLLTSLFFGFLHANNQNATLISSLNLALAGLFLGLGFILTGELAIPIGLHIAWNFAQGYIFGFPVSGVEEPLSLIATQQTGPIDWTGGAFGPEGGLFGVLAFLLGMLLIYGWVRWTRRRVTVQTELAKYSTLERQTVREALHITT